MITGLGHHCTRIDGASGSGPALGVPAAELRAHRGHERLGALRDLEQAADVAHVAVDVLDGDGLRRDVGQAGRVELLDDALVTGHRECREHEVGLERRDLLHVDVEVRPHARERADHLDGVVRVVVDAYQEALAPEGADDLRVGAGE
ncbi:MAG TPA: hypothetical protein VM198_04380 [Longimicrobiales bacterium]|nr:hypothetical protein [Longimicrobiales bacterium]